MAKKFEFNDEKDIQQDEYQQPSRIDEFEDMKETQTDESVNDNQVSDEFESVNKEDNQSMTKKKKKKFIWKWWYYLVIALGVLFIAFMIYIFVLSNNDGPVYGPRCEGVSEIANDLRKATVDTAKKDHSEIQDVTMEIACKQLKVDIVFKEGTATKDAQNIAEKVVQTLDDLVGKPKDDGKTYSNLFGKIDNVYQYEVNLFLTESGNDDFPIYGTKNVQNDEFSYTLASVRDEDSQKKAQETLTEKDDN